MGNIFYNSVSILVGIILICYFIINIVKKHIIGFSIFGIVFGALFLGLGIFGFFLPKEYEVITVLGMLALCIIMIIVLLLLKNKDKE